MYRSRVRAAYSLTRAVPCSRSTCFASLFSQRRYATKKLGGDNNGNADVEAALKFAKDNKAQLVDFRFCDLYGAWQHIQTNIRQLDASSFENGLAFDGSSFRGWQPINMSDMLLIPIANTKRMDPFTKHPTVTFVSKVCDPTTKEAYHKDPRNVAIKAARFLRESGIADCANVGSEAEFFLFDSVAYSVTGNKGYYEVDSVEGHWNSGQHHTGHYKIRPKEGYFPAKPTDSLQDIRSEIVGTLVAQGFHVETSHHEVAPGQCEIDFHFDDLVTTGDNVLLFKYIVRNVASQSGKTASFMPKPIPADNGSGMHTHFSLHNKDGTNLFTGDKYAGLSETALYFVGGVMKHAKAICAFTNPTINSYKRLVPGFEAPINFAYSGRNRSAAVRIPISHPKARRLEFRTPDPSCNPYLSFAAILMAGIDGIQNRIDPGEPFDKDVYSLTQEELRDVVKAPGSLEEAINGLEEDHDFLVKGDVFTQDLVDTWIQIKKKFEIGPWKKQPTPLEFYLYFDV